MCIQGQKRAWSRQALTGTIRSEALHPTRPHTHTLLLKPHTTIVPFFISKADLTTAPGMAAAALQCPVRPDAPETEHRRGLTSCSARFAAAAARRSCSRTIPFSLAAAAACEPSLQSDRCLSM